MLPNYIEAPHAIVPSLIEHYEIQADGESRASIVEVVWQHRQHSTVDFLAAALGDAHAEVWKQALDGLVAIGGPRAEAALEAFLTDRADDERTPWVKEALQQLRS